jgi:Fe2+ transport system protein FeoA
MTDPAFAELISELRDARTPTPAALETRLDELLARTPVAAAPRARRRLRLPRRGPVVWLLGGCAVVALGVIGASQLPSSSTRSFDQSYPAAAGSTAAAPAFSTAAAAEPTAGAPSSAAGGATERDGLTGSVTSGKPAPATDVPAVGDTARLQHQTARLTIALKSADDVSDATGQVTRAITSYGGHIVTVQFATPEGTAARSEIVAKVPIERMQEATDRFTALGRLAGAQVDISDLQERADSLEQRVAGVRLQIARFDAQLAATDLSKLQRATLVERRARARQRLADLNADVSATKQEAALADLTVVLVTDDRAPVPADDSGPGARARDALGLVAAAGVYALYAVIVAAPVLLVVGLLIGGRRLLRRRRDRRLLETA